jgi:hypothetical protein
MESELRTTSGNTTLVVLYSRCSLHATVILYFMERRHGVLPRHVKRDVVYYLPNLDYAEKRSKCL